MHKINSLNHSLLAYTQEFLRWLFLHNLSNFSLTSLRTTCFIKSSFGVCSCFSLFNLQGTPLPLEPPALRDSLHMIPCLPLFVKRFFEFFEKISYFFKRALIITYLLLYCIIVFGCSVRASFIFSLIRCLRAFVRKSELFSLISSFYTNFPKNFKAVYKKI